MVAAGTLLFYAAAIIFGELNQDEGWYLYAGRLIYEGRHPFRDFASTQGPVIAYVYALAYPLVRIGGLLAGRLFTAGMGGVSVLATGLLAWRMVAGGTESRPREHRGRERATLAGLLAAGLLGLNLYHVYFTSIVKTYALSGLLLVTGLLALERSLRAADRDGARAAFGYGFLSAALLALAAGSRLSAGILLPALWLTLAVLWLRGGHRFGGRMSLAGMLAGGTVTLLAVFMPFLLTAPDALRFGLLQYHGGRRVEGVFPLVAYKAGFLLRLTAAYFPVAVLWAVGIMGRMCEGRHAREPSCETLHDGLPVLTGVGVIAVTGVHMAAPFPYDDYQVFVMPCMTVIAGLAMARFLTGLKIPGGLRVAVATVALLLMFAHSISSPLPQSWMLAGRDRIWWPMKTETPLQRLRRAAAEVRRLQGDTAAGELLTQDTYLAIEAGLRVPSGFELGPFSYFPGLSSATASRYHVLNTERLLHSLETATADVAAFSGYGMAIRAPEIKPVSGAETAQFERALERRYEEAMRIEDFGQASTTLRLFIRKR